MWWHMGAPEGCERPWSRNRSINCIGRETCCGGGGVWMRVSHHAYNESRGDECFFPRGDDVRRLLGMWSDASHMPSLVPLVSFARFDVIWA